MKPLVMPLRTWLVASHLVVLLLPVVALLATRALAYDLRDQTRRTLEYQGVLIAMLAADEVADARRDNTGTTLADANGPLTRVLVRTKRATLAGIRLVDPSGIVVVSSGDGIGQDLSADTEVHDALTAGRVGVAVRPRNSSLSARSRTPLSSASRRSAVRLFVTIPILLDGEQLGAVVMSRTPREELQAIYQMAPRLWWGALAAVIATIALALMYGALFSRSLRHMARVAPAIALEPGKADALLDRAQRSHIQEVAMTARALIATAERLDERLAYIGEFAANVSHEFKTPLSTLRGTIELLSDDEDMPPEQRARFLANATSELSRMERLVSGLLALARAERAQRSEVNIDTMLSAIAERYPGTQVRGAGGSIAADREQLELLITNLVQNAHTHGGQHVEIAVTRSTQALCIVVKDDGPGISLANQEQLFERFFTTARGDGGTGLGLALARAVATAHGGTVDLSCESGRTAFTVRLPR